MSSENGLTEREAEIARRMYGRGWYGRERELIEDLGACGDEIRSSRPIPAGLCERAMADVAKDLIRKTESKE